jgi:hypothetical protein
MVNRPANKKMYRTMQGRLVDIDRLRASNENVPAVGNMNVNARGDVLGPRGKIAKTKEQVMKQYYQTPKGKADDTPIQKVPEPKPIPQVRVEQVKTMNPTVKTAVKNTVQKETTKTENKSGIDAALDGIE